jgi:hypothetical protein
MVPAIQQVHAATQSIEGVISDSMCGKKHMQPSKNDAGCTAKCVKSGAGYALVVGKKVYTLAGKPETIAPFAGKHVTVDGSVKGHIITVASVVEAEGATMPGMSGMPM